MSSYGNAILKTPAWSIMSFSRHTVALKWPIVGSLDCVYSVSVHCTQLMKRRQAQIRLDNAAGTAAYRQIADQLRTLIVEGVLRHGDSLPPVRRLALELGVHFNTTAEAYRALAEEGFLEI